MPKENSRLGVVAAFVVVGTLLCLGLVGVAQADAASKPRVSASFGVAGFQVKVSGTVSKGAPRKAPARKKWKAALEQQVGKRWVKRKSGKLSKGKRGSSKYKLTWKAPSSLKSGKFRVRVFAGKRTISSSKIKKLTFSTQVPAPKVSEVVSSSVQKLPTQDDMTLVVSGNRSYRAGEYLAATPGDGAPDGFLLEVVSSSSSGGSTTVRVKPGSLYDAVPNGQLSLSTGDLQAATPQNGDARTLLRALDTSGSASNYTNVPFSKPVTCTGSGSMTIDGNFDASLAPNFDLKWSKRFGIPTGIDSARATVDANLSADASAELSAAASCTLTPITLLAPKFTFVVVVGPVPVPVTVSLPIVLEASASVSGSVTISADASVQGSLGLDYRDGDVSAVKEFSSDANLNHEVEAQANAEALIGPDIEVEAGWKIPVIGGIAAEVEINARTGLRLEYIVGNSPPGKLCVPLKLGGEVEFDTPIGDIEKALPEYSTDIKCVEFGSNEVADLIPKYRGWVAVEVATQASSVSNWSDNFERAIVVDSSRTTTDSSWSAVAHTAGAPKPPSPSCQKSAFDESGSGSFPMTFNSGANSSIYSAGLPVPTQVLFVGWQGVMGTSGNSYQWDCDGGPYVGAASRNVNIGGAALPAPGSDFISDTPNFFREYTFERGLNAGETITEHSVICLTRSTVDQDLDGLPDLVDLAPNNAAAPTNLGSPSGTSASDETIPSYFGEPSGIKGIPSCPGL